MVEHFIGAMDILKEVEHSNRNDKLLHKNAGENGLTFFGIYQSAHPNLKMWKTINRYLEIEPNLAKCSLILSNVGDLKDEVYNFYKKEFWDKMQLDKVDSGHICNEMFIFGVNVGYITCIKETQKLLGVTADGIIGSITLGKLNAYDVVKFDKEFDKIEMAYYERIAKAKPHLAINLKGWFNRAVRV